MIMMYRDNDCDYATWQVQNIPKYRHYRKLSSSKNGAAEWKEEFVYCNEETLLHICENHVKSVAVLCK